MTLKAIVFDFDGVILESLDIKTQAFKELFRGYPQHLESILKFHFDNGGLSRFEKFKIVYRDYVGQPLDDDESERLGHKFSELVCDKVLRCAFVPGAPRFLQSRAQQYVLYVASGTPQNEIEVIVKQRKLDKFFCKVYGSPSNKSDILGEILAEGDMQPDEIVLIGDALGDYKSARQMAVPFIGRVPPGATNPFPNEGVVAVVQDLQQLDLQWVSLAKHWSKK